MHMVEAAIEFEHFKLKVNPTDLKDSLVPPL